MILVSNTVKKKKNDQMAVKWLGFYSGLSQQRAMLEMRRSLIVSAVYSRHV